MFATLFIFLLFTALQEPSTLRQDLEEARSLVHVGDGAAAHACLDKLLMEHEGEALVIKHLPAIQEVFLDSLYLEQVAASKSGNDGAAPEIPFLANVLSYKEKTGQYKLRWEGKQLSDFVLVDGELRFPLALSGRFRVAIELNAYPQTQQIKVMMDDGLGQKYEIDCGLGAKGLNRQVAKVYAVGGGKFDQLDREDKKLPIPGKKVLLQFKGVGRSVQIFAGNKKYMNFKTGGAAIGTITFQHVPEDALLAVEYDGLLEGEALTALMHEMRAQNHATFLREINLETYFPEWLHPHLGAAEIGFEQMPPPGGTPQGDVASAWEETLQRISWTRSVGIPIEGLSSMQDQAPEGLPPVLKEYASLRMALEGGYWGYAEGHARNVLNTNPEHEPTRTMYLESSIRSGHLASAWGLAKGYDAQNPGSRKYLSFATLMFMRVGKAAEVLDFIKQEPEMDTHLKQSLLTFIDKRNIPAGESMRTESSALVAITSDVDAETLTGITQWLEGELQRAESFLPGEASTEGKKVRVFLFADRWDYEEYLADVLNYAHPSSSGFYCPEYDAVVAWANPNQKEFEESLRREAVIQYGKQISVEFPIWACIGLAELVADRHIVPGKKLKSLSSRAEKICRTGLQEGLIRYGVMLQTSDHAYYEMDRFMDMKVQAWSMMLVLHYAEAEDDPRLGILQELMTRARSGKTWAAIVDEFFFQWETSNGADDAYARIVKSIGSLEGR